MLALLIWQRAAIDDRAVASRAARRQGSEPGTFSFLRLPSVWLCFSFFFFSTCALSAIQSFAGPALSKMYELPLSTTAYVVTGYMVAGALGILPAVFLPCARAPGAR